MRDSPPWAASPRTSSTRPASRMAAKRCSMRRAEHVGRQPDADHRDGEHGGAVRLQAGPERRERLPVMRITSSARTMRRELPGSMRAAATGSTRCELGVGRRQAFGARDLGFELGADREVLGRERERVDDGLHVQAGAADEQRALAPRLRCRRPRRVPRPGSAPPTSLPTGRRRRSGGAGPQPARGRWAWRCRCRGRGTPASSRPRRSRRRRGRARRRARDPTCRTRWGRRVRGAVTQVRP